MMSSRYVVICHLAEKMQVEITRAEKLVDELEKLGLVQFDQAGELRLKVCEVAV